MFCSKCGAELVEGARFCPECAEPVVSPENINQAAESPVTAVAGPLPRKPANKNRIIAIILMAILVALLVAFGAFLIKYLSDSKNTPSGNFEMRNAEDIVIDEEKKGYTNPSNSLDDMLFVINGVEYQFPLKLEEFTRNGWTPNSTENLDEIIEPDDYTVIYVISGDNMLAISVYNPGDKAAAIDDCFVGEISVRWADVVLPGNVSPHKTTRKEIKEIYGMPEKKSSDVYWYYGKFSEGSDDLFFGYPIRNRNPIITLKFDDSCKDKGSKNGDLLKFVDIQWFDPDAAEKYEKRGGE